MLKDTDQFWRWFTENEDVLHDFEGDIHHVFEVITIQLAEIDENVTFEISSVDAAGVRIFAFTAGGIGSSFPAVERLVDTSPALKRWRFVKYRQRVADLLIVEYDGKRVDPIDVHYVIVKDQCSSKAGILLFFEGYVEKQRDVYASIAYLMLDQALGEFIVETRVGIVEVFDRSSKYYLSAKPVKGLGESFDNIMRKLEPDHSIR